MFVMHIALQGCLKAGTIEYGRTTDTGGHIRYLLELVRALETTAGVSQQLVVTRGFRDAALGAAYARRTEALSPATPLLRVFGGTDSYLPKEELHRDMPALADDLCNWLDAAPRKPDLLHAHYADAGTMAAIIKKRFAIPVVFTAHSLGRVKRRDGYAVDGGRSADVLSVREKIEEHALANADLVLASSRDEAERQYGLYRNARPERIVVNPPGSDLSTFHRIDQPGIARVARSIAPFLSAPRKPPLLAIARPVRRKNLGELVRAFGECHRLQAAANLVIFAGCRGDIEDLEPENRAVLRDVLDLIDGYDLWGKVAVPKNHQPHDVPAIYQHARKLGGVFVNAALSEPFGLTLLEAAAVGLPVIATNEGGPNDILKRCRNGLLVSPRVRSEVSGAAIRLLEQPEFYAECSAAGRRNSTYYCWNRHAEAYVHSVSGLVEKVRTVERARRPRPESMFLSDIDNTLTGDRKALADFGVLRRSRPGMVFGIATGRSIHSAIDVLSREKAPVPDVMVTSVGSEIYYTRNGRFDLTRDDVWSKIIASGWRRDAIRAVLAADPRLVPQAEIEQRAFKLSYFAKTEPRLIDDLSSKLAEQGLLTTLVASHGRFLDVLPATASKGAALRYLARRFGIPLERTASAGDSGNDADMLTAAGTGILVANHNAEVAWVAACPNVRLSSRAHAAAILEELSHLFPAPSGTVPTADEKA